MFSKRDRNEVPVCHRQSVTGRVAELAAGAREGGLDF